MDGIGGAEQERRGNGVVGGDGAEGVSQDRTLRGAIHLDISGNDSVTGLSVADFGFLFFERTSCPGGSLVFLGGTIVKRDFKFSLTPRTIVTWLIFF